jgi:hypothetical protein
LKLCRPRSILIVFVAVPVVGIKWRRIKIVWSEVSAKIGLAPKTLRQTVWHGDCLSHLVWMFLRHEMEVKK